MIKNLVKILLIGLIATLSSSAFSEWKVTPIESLKKNSHSGGDKGVSVGTGAVKVVVKCPIPPKRVSKNVSVTVNSSTVRAPTVSTSVSAVGSYTHQNTQQ